MNGIEGSKRFSFTTATDGSGEEIRSYDPATGRDTLRFTARGPTFPATAEPFEHRSFQWVGDSRHLIFQTSSRPASSRRTVAPESRTTTGIVWPIGP